jgi:DNA polymerase V
MKKISKISVVKSEKRKIKKIDSLLPLFNSPVSAGFPTPANDEMTEAIDLNTFLIHNKLSTYLLRVQGTSLLGIGILEDDILVVDASLTHASGKIVVASIDGEFLVKRYVKEKGGIWLKAENPRYSPIRITADMETSIVGVVVGVVRKM